MSENRNWKQEYGEMTVEELEQRYREAFFYTDKIDKTVYTELERLGETLEEKRDVEFASTAEGSWKRFSRDHGEELDRACADAARSRAAAKAQHRRNLLRGTLIAVALIVLLAGTVLAVGPHLWAWVRGWNVTLGQAEPMGTETAEQPIPKALERLGITEPLYTAWLPTGYGLTEAHIIEDPLILFELHTRGDRFIAITVTPVSAAETSLFPREDLPVQEYRAGESRYCVFSGEGNYTGVWYTENYCTTVSGNITLKAMKRLMESVCAK